VKNFVAGAWIDKAKKIEVTNPFDNSVIDAVPRADARDLDIALAFAERGAKVMAKLSSYERWKILRKAADMMAARSEELGQIISQEEGKIIAEGRGEAMRAVETIMGSAEEAKRLHGETVPLDADPTGGKKLGFTLRRRRGDRAVQLPIKPRLPQSWPRAGGG
jgi:acyl-CoA reductase-like NAD-dependent aldehyde dehydrogenase